MAFGKRIVQEIELRGDQVKREFASINREGKAAFDGIAKSGEAPAAALANIEQSAKRAGSTFADFLSKFRGAGFRQFGGDAKVAADGLKDVNDNVVPIAGNMANASAAATRLGGVFRGLSKATGVREIGFLGRNVTILGRAFAVAAPVIFAAGLGKVASSASDAAGKVADLAAENKTSTSQFQELVSAETAVGGSAEDAGKGMKGLSDLIKETASNTKQSDDKLRNLSDQLAETKNKAVELSRGFVDIAREADKAFRDITRSQRDSAIDFAQSLEKINQERKDITSGQEISPEEQRKRKLADLDQQEANLRRKYAEEQQKAEEARKEAARKQQEDTRKLIEQQEEQRKKQQEIERAMADARVEAENNKTALDKLGVSATTSTGKLKKAPEVLLEIADALKGIPDEATRVAVGNDLIAAGMDRKLIPALSRGSEAYKALVAEGARIRPPFTPNDFKVADEFTISMEQAKDALGALKDAIGLAVAPTFTAFFQGVTSILVENRSAILEFAGVVGGALKSALDGIGIIINSTIVPAFNGFMAIVNGAAQVINSVFGTSLTGPQLLAAALLALAIAFGGIPGVIVAVVIALGQFKQLMDDNPVATKVVIGVLTALAIAFGSIPIAIAAVLIALGLIVKNWDELKAAGSKVAEILQQAWEQFANWFSQTWAGQIINSIKEVIKWFGSLGSARQDSGGDATGAVPGFAGGGHVRGPGTGTSDSIPAFLSNDEHIIRAKAARYYGHGLFKAFNQMRIPRNLIRGFAMGGVASIGRMPTLGGPLRMAKGGPVAKALRPLSVTFPGIGTFEDLLAPENVARKMIKISTSKQLRSGGKKPSSYGGR